MNHSMVSALHGAAMMVLLASANTEQVAIGNQHCSFRAQGHIALQAFMERNPQTNIFDKTSRTQYQDVVSVNELRTLKKSLNNSSSCAETSL